jgi:uncharacterized protein YkwD
MPDGDYRFVVSTVAGGRKTVDRSGLLTVANGGTAGTPAPSSPAAPTGKPAAPSSPAAAPAAPTTRPTTATPTRPAPTTTRSTPRPATSTSRPATTPATVPQQPSGGSFTDQVVVLTNAQRASAGCPALSVNGTLTSVAQAHSQDMATRGFFDHNSPDGRSPFDRMTAAGYQFRSAAENIAAGQRSPQDVVTAWMNSSGHRANILNCGLTEIGVGYATGGSFGTYWTQDFGTPR